MATFNGARFLPEQIDSLLRQTRKPDEIVISDDGSTDGTMELLHDYAARFPELFKVSRNSTQLGYRENFSEASSRCSGDWVLFCDQDDYWFPTKIERVLDAVASRPEILLWINDMEMADEALRPLGHSVFDNVRRMNLPLSWSGPGCGTAVRSDLLKLALPFPPERKGHDDWINGFALLLGVRGEIDEVLQYYRRHEGATTDTVASGSRPTGRFALLRSEAFKPVTAGWTEDQAVLNLVESRLSERPLSSALRERAPPTLRKLRNQRSALRSRLQIISLPRWRRWLPIANFWRTRGYDEFGGAKSMLKDLIRRRE
ncbi:glycosyltransferase family 2 protein [Sphingomonas sp. LY160]|uniref:glycosyltransferase family 2 protein n=1 Tax=Sphingomonas sp. LY160 TaxID=3095342 RepID=UPI003A0FCD49